MAACESLRSAARALPECDSLRSAAVRFLGCSNTHSATGTANCLNATVAAGNSRESLFLCRFFDYIIRSHHRNSECDPPLRGTRHAVYAKRGVCLVVQVLAGSSSGQRGLPTLVSMSNVLEDAVERLAPLPQDVRRVLELVKDLDTRWTLRFAELKRQHSLYIDHVKTAVAGQPRDGSVDLAALVGDQKPWLERIAALKREVSQLADEKVALAQQVRASVASRLHRELEPEVDRDSVGTDRGVNGARAGRGNSRPWPLWCDAVCFAQCGVAPLESGSLRPSPSARPLRPALARRPSSSLSRTACASTPTWARSRRRCGARGSCGGTVRT
jgi:hypothetical protein